MDVILVRDVPKVGKAGSIVDVSSGYARNYLLPNHLCVPSTPGILEKIESKKRYELRKQAEVKEQALVLAKKINGLSCTVKMQAGEGDRLYGAVTNHNVHEALNQLGVHVEKRQIIIEEPIRKLGQAQVKVVLHPEVQATLKVWVVKQ